MCPTHDYERPPSTPDAPHHPNHPISLLAPQRETVGIVLLVFMPVEKAHK